MSVEKPSSELTLTEILDMDTLLAEAGKFAHDQDERQPDMHPKTASFQGFTAGAKWMATKMACYILQEAFKK